MSRHVERFDITLDGDPHEIDLPYVMEWLYVRCPDSQDAAIRIAPLGLAQGGGTAVASDVSRVLGVWTDGAGATAFTEDTYIPGRVSKLTYKGAGSATQLYIEGEYTTPNAGSLVVTGSTLTPPKE